MQTTTDTDEAATAFLFRLYLAGGTHNSIIALGQINRLCDTHLVGRHRIDIVDVLQEPERALADGVFLTPMLVKLLPLPIQRVVGTLSDMPLLMLTLGLRP